MEAWRYPTCSCSAQRVRTCCNCRPGRWLRRPGLVAGGKPARRVSGSLHLAVPASIHWRTHFGGGGRVRGPGQVGGPDGDAAGAGVRCVPILHEQCDHRWACSGLAVLERGLSIVSVVVGCHQAPSSGVRASVLAVRCRSHQFGAVSGMRACLQLTIIRGRHQGCGCHTSALGQHEFRRLKGEQKRIACTLWARPAGSVTYCRFHSVESVFSCIPMKAVASTGHMYDMNLHAPPCATCIPCIVSTECDYIASAEA